MVGRSNNPCHKAQERLVRLVLSEMADPQSPHFSRPYFSFLGKEEKEEEGTPSKSKPKRPAKKPKQVEEEEEPEEEEGDDEQEGSGEST